MLRLRWSNKNERRQFEHAAGPLEFGRSPKADSLPRCVIQDPCVSKDHLRLEELPDGRVQVENLSQKYPIYLAKDRTLAPGERCELPLPLRLGLGETVLAIDAVGDPVRRNMLETLAPPVSSQRLPEVKQTLRHLGQSPSPELLTQWFESVIAVQRAAVGSPEFYDQTARALVELVGLDRGLVLRRQGEEWHVAARAARDEKESGEEFSQTILRYVLEERRTFYQTSTAGMPRESLRGIGAIVASPIFDATEQIVGVLYGCRIRQNRDGSRSIGPLEAQVVQLLASTVGVGLAREAQDAEAFRLRMAKGAAEETDPTRSHFLANKSHELRTALDAILGSSEKLLKEARDRGQESFLPDLDKIDTAAKHLLQLLNDFLDRSKCGAVLLIGSSAALLGVLLPIS